MWVKLCFSHYHVNQHLVSAQIKGRVDGVGERSGEKWVKFIKSALIRAVCAVKQTNVFVECVTGSLRSEKVELAAAVKKQQVRTAYLENCLEDVSKQVCSNICVDLKKIFINILFSWDELINTKNSLNHTGLFLQNYFLFKKSLKEIWNGEILLREFDLIIVKFQTLF